MSLLLAVIASVHTTTAEAATTIVVTTTGDELNTDGDCSLREAIQAANTDTAVDTCPAGSGADTLMVPAGTYVLSIAGAGEDANATGDLDVTTDLTITATGSGNTIVAGPVGWDDRIVDVIPGIVPGTGDATVAISGLTVSGGNTDGNGGGIRGLGGSLDLSLSEVVLSGNTATNTAAGEGGGLFSSTLGNLVLRDVTATDNTSVNQGGGIRTGGASSVVMENLTLTNNQSTGQTSASSGGGLYLQDQNATIRGLMATGNAATLFGGVALFGGGGLLEFATISENTAATIGGGLRVGDGWTIHRASIKGNLSVGEAGGVLAEGSATIQNTTIDGNTALRPSFGTSLGGGIRGLGFTLERVAVTNNTADNGGGIAVNPSAIRLTNVTISGNRGGGFWGGGSSTQPEMVFHNSTIAYNQAGACEAGTTSQCGSAIDTAGGSVALENVITAGPEPLCSSFETYPAPGAIVSAGHNLDTGNTCAGGGPGDQINTDPLLSPLASNDGPLAEDDPPDGPTKTHALLPGSPAIDAGSSNCPATDQRGIVRPEDGDLDGTPICDIGAYEFVPPRADLSITKTDSQDPVTVGGTLTYTLHIANAGPDAAADVTVTDNLPASVSFVSAASSQGSCSHSAGTVTCSTGNFASGGTATVTIEVTPNSVGTITNNASVGASTHDPNATNNSVSEDTAVVDTRIDGAMNVIVNGSTKSVASGGSHKVFVTNVCNLGTVNVTVDPADISTSRTVNGAPAGGTVTLLSSPTPMLLRPGACQRYRFDWSYGTDGPANPRDVIIYEATWNLAGDGVSANNTDSEIRTAT